MKCSKYAPQYQLGVTQVVCKNDLGRKAAETIMPLEQAL